MQIDISNKLQNYFELDEILEKDAVYFLVEAYKLIELEEVKEQFPALCFYRNWSVHSKITRESTFKDQLEEIFKEVHLPEKEIPLEVLRFGYFDTLAKEIIIFWKTYFENRDMKTTDLFFLKFRNALLKVLADVPIFLKYRTEEVKLVFDKKGTLNILGPNEYRGAINFL